MKQVDNMKNIVCTVLSLVGILNTATVQALPGLNFDRYYDWSRCLQVSSHRSSRHCSVTVSNRGGPHYCGREQALRLKVHIATPNPFIGAGVACMGICGKDVIFTIDPLEKGETVTVSREHEHLYCTHRITNVQKVR